MSFEITHVDVLTSGHAFAQIAGEWDDLLANTDESLEEAGVFSNATWLTTWQQFFAPNPFVITLRNASGVLLAGAAMHITRRVGGLFSRLPRRLMWMGSNPTISENMCVLYRAGCDESCVLKHVADAIASYQHRWDVLELEFCAHLHQLEAFSGYLQHLLGSVHLGQSEVVPSMPLPNNLATYDENKPTRQRKNLNNAHNRLKREYHDSEICLTDATSVAEAEQFMAEFSAIHKTYWAGRGCKSEFERFERLSEFYTTYFRTEREANSLQKPQLSLSRYGTAQSTMNYMVAMQSPRCCCTHMMVYNKDFARFSPGKCHYEAIFRDSIEKHIPKASFGRGMNEIKTMWHPEQPPVYSLIGYRHGWLACCDSMDGWLRARLKQWWHWRRQASPQPFVETSAKPESGETHD